MKKLLLFAFLFCLSIVHAQVGNDECLNSVEVPVSPGMTCVTGTTATFTGATASPQVNTCAGTADDDVWFYFTSTQSKHNLNLTASPELLQELKGAIYVGGCMGSTTPQCLEFSNGVAELHNLVPNGLYYIRLYTESDIPQTATATVCVTTLPPIIIETTYTAQQLVEDVLIDSPCVQVSNITASGGSNFGQPASLGAFKEGNTAFPFSKGIILTTGSVVQATGPNSLTVLGNYPGWGGDVDLQVLMGGQPAPLTNSDATVLEFDFVPMIDNISFDFLFASEEYGQFQCEFGDAFAFILTNLATGVKTNLAVVPGTNIPIAVTTINNNAYNPQCQSQNPQYFGAYYGTAPGNLAAPVNFNGVTVPLTAQSQVTPGQQYHIKLVIANKMDHHFPSAVFIDAGSFNIGGLTDANVELASSAGTILCEGTTTTLSVNTNSSFNYMWFKDNVAITGADTNTLVVTEPGDYKVSVQVPGSPGCGQDYHLTIYGGGVQDEVEIQDYWIYEAQSDGIATFDLNTIVTEITDVPQGDLLSVTFHLTQDDAVNGFNQLPLLFTNTANPQAIYVRIESFTNGCYTTSSFRIGAVDENYIAPAPAGSTSQTFTEGQTLADLEVQGENIQWYSTPGSSSGFAAQTFEADTPLAPDTLLVDGETYYASQTLFGIESTNRLAVTAHLVLGATENQLPHLKFYPNPINDILTITNAEAIDKYEVFSVVGQIVKYGENKESEITFNMEDFSPGIYLIKVYSGKQARTLKVLKK